MDKEMAGRIIDDLRAREDVDHVSRFDMENKEIQVRIDPEDLERPERVIAPSDVLERLSNGGYMITYARFGDDDKRELGFRLFES